MVCKGNFESSSVDISTHVVVKVVKYWDDFSSGGNGEVVLKENGKGIESEGDVKDMNEEPADAAEEPAPIEENAEEPAAEEPTETGDTEANVDEEVGAGDAAEEKADGEEAPAEEAAETTEAAAGDEGAVPAKKSGKDTETKEKSKRHRHKRQ